MVKGQSHIFRVSAEDLGYTALSDGDGGVVYQNPDGDVISIPFQDLTAVADHLIRCYVHTKRS